MTHFTFLDTQLPFTLSLNDFHVNSLEHFVIGPNSFREIDRILDHESDATKPSELFLISCSLTCIEYILQKVIIQRYCTHMKKRLMDNGRINI